MRVTILHDEVLAGARPDERDALVQAETILQALMALGHEACSAGAQLDLDRLAHRLAHDAPDLVFNLTESLGGHSRLIHLVPALLAALAIPYTGASAEAQLLTSNKLLAKRLMAAHGLPTPAWRTAAELEGRATRVSPGRSIIKSVWEHASIGIDGESVVEVATCDALRGAIAGRADRLGGEAFAETFIDGREFNVTMLCREGSAGPQILPPAEMRFDAPCGDHPRVMTYSAKWDEGSPEYHGISRHFDFGAQDVVLLRRLEALAADCWRLFELDGYARVDFRVDEHGQPWILEVNANPCLSPDAGFAAALQIAGISYTEAIDRIVQDGLCRGRRRAAPLQAALGSH